MRDGGEGGDDRILDRRVRRGSLGTRLILAAAGLEACGYRDAKEAGASCG